MKILILLILMASAMGQTTHTTASQEGNNAFTGNNTHSGSETFTGSLSAGVVTAGRIFKRCFVDGVTYTTIVGAYNDSTNCSSVWLPPGYTETLSANLTLNRPSVPIICEQKCTITQGTNQVLVTKGTNHVTVIGLIPWGSSSAGASEGFSWVYTGTGNAWQVSDNTGTSTIDFVANGVYWNLNGAGASATALKLFNVQQYKVDDSECFLNAASQVCIATDGTGLFTGNGRFLGLSVRTGVSASAVKAFNFGTLSTHTQIIGGSWALDAAAGIGIDISGPNSGSIELMNPNCNTALTCVVVESTATSSAVVVGDIRTDSGVTNLANFATGTRFNHIRCIDCATTAVVTDTDGASTSGNSVETIDGNVLNTRYAIVKVNQTSYNVLTAAGAGFLACTYGSSCTIGTGAGNAKLTVDGGGRLTSSENSNPSGNAGLLTQWDGLTDHMWKYNTNNQGEQHVPMNGIVTSAYTNATTTASNITGLSFTVKASTNYTLMCDLYYQGSAGTAGLDITITGPAAPTSVFYSYDESPTATSIQDSVASAFGTKLVGNATVTSTTNLHARVTMGLQNGVNSGTVQVQGSATGAGTVTIQVGSFCQIQ